MDTRGRQRSGGGSRTVRVDLTSLDLRSGTISLPLQEQDRFPPGNITGTSLNDGSSHDLHFEPPRELQGLRSFFEQHSLRPNDAVILHLHADRLELEPVRRRARRGSRPAEKPAVDSGDGTSRQEAEIAPEAPEAPGTASPAGAAAPEPAPEGDGEEPAASPEPRLPEAMEPQEEADAGQAEPVAAFAMPTERPAVPEAAWHVVPRRQFALPGKGPAYAPARPASPWLEAAARARDPEGTEATPEREQEPPPAPEATPTGPGAGVRQYLERPDLPSIIQAAEVARQLGIDASEAEETLQLLSAEADSRLSAVRPGFWLLRRRQPDG